MKRPKRLLTYPRPAHFFFNFHPHEGHMNDSQAIHKFGQHLSDIQVAFVLAFDKVKVTQQKIASLVNCSRNAVRTALTNYTFETFKGCKPRRNYQRITMLGVIKRTTSFSSSKKTTFRSWSGLRNPQISTHSKTFGQTLKNGSTNDLLRCSTIHRRASKRDIDTERFCRRYGIRRERRWWRR